MSGMQGLPPAAAAFDAIAEGFDARFTPWLSVAAQRRAVRMALARAFPPGARVIEIGGGTGEDALWLLERGREVLLTDASPAMVRLSGRKFAGRAGARTALCAAEDLAGLATRISLPLDGAFSNFAALNCVGDLRPFAAGLATLLREGAPAILVMFGRSCPGEWVTEMARGRPAEAFRRLGTGNRPARLGGRTFNVRYHGRRDIEGAMAPWFRPDGRLGVGVFVPPSAAEPWISGHPRLLDAFERLDRVFAGPLARLGDHILYRFVRNGAEAR
ncbi:class I SAM-dependent methyltransferase [Gluconacetobacter aggeris]|uniref:Class I SAM-dependent methyltransferase n=1 Tax=Gluconacetobacter aggeris TaxID=1286186 RepID=A0A7W4IUB3_9PROT|nr:class I SAM-dependent methyltransferase [Gluconacetobacter aggeris]MBB2169205.1 class I SAM-dependent methyltransferase [Gluconacetobacter aggeris]